ncbi:hypothetical protein RvY_01160 [Ramazzottius varieornatus]|uniref:Uncharacterized protein n=1 Tax=Ramazzottius varieornatus TaxID=947166 RepID=A0A1D1UJA0_RAMVA|nr:hypothetical protein RvY_01160 [Ramazzottius varieornatus]
MENSFGLSSVFIVTNTFLRQDPEHRKALCRFYESRTEEPEGKLIRSVPLEDADVEQFLAGELGFPELEYLPVNRENSDNGFDDPVASGAETESPPSKGLRSDGN